MIRILQCVNIMDRAGLETMLMNYYRNIDRTQIQFDFLTHRPNKGAYDDEIESLGGKVYHAPRLYPQNYPTYFKWMTYFFNEHPEYKIVHSHIDSMSFFPLYAAKNAGIPVRIAHSHTSKLDKDLKLPIKFLTLKLIPYVANYYCACGELAGKFMFGKRDFKIIKNAIDVEKYRFDKEIRKRKQDELGLNGKFIIGHVGRYCYIKNQLFLLEIFAEVKREKENAHLLLIGKGEDEIKIREKVHILHLDGSVSFLIDRDDVDQLYQVMDIFVMPSLFEGLPVVGVEAQANGLPCIISDKISREIVLSECVRMLRLEDGIDKWKESILSTKTERNMNSVNQLENKGYNVRVEANRLAAYYILLMKGASRDGTIDDNYTNI